MKKCKCKKIKQLIAVLLVVVLSCDIYAAIVSDNDGSAFVTKAEFDALKASFNKQIDDYNTSIDTKIDGAIASYLSGIKIDKITNVTLPLKIKNGMVTLVQKSSLPITWGHLGADIFAHIQQLDNRINVVTARQGNTLHANPYFSTQYEFSATWPAKENIMPCITKENHDDNKGTWAGYNKIKDTLTSTLVRADGLQAAGTVAYDGIAKYVSGVAPNIVYLPEGHYTDLSARGWVAFGDSSGDNWNRFLCYKIWDASATIPSSDITKVYTNMDNIIVWNNENDLSFRNLSGYYDWAVDSLKCDINSRELYEDVNTVFSGRYWNRAVVASVSTLPPASIASPSYTYSQQIREGNTWIKMANVTMLNNLAAYPTANIGIDPYVIDWKHVSSNIVNKGALNTGSVEHDVISGIPVATLKRDQKLVWNMTFLDDKTYRIYLSNGPYNAEPTDANSLEISTGKNYFEFTGTHGRLEYTAKNSGETNVWMKWCVMDIDGTTRLVGGTLVLPNEGDIFILSE